MVKKLRNPSDSTNGLRAYGEAVDKINLLKTRNINFHVSTKQIIDAYVDEFLYEDGGKNLYVRRYKSSFVRKMISDFLNKKQSELTLKNKTLDDFYERIEILEEIEKMIKIRK